MKYNSYIKPFRTLYSRITMWIMLTVLVVFVIITYLVTYFGAKGVLLGSTENAKSRMEITNQRINTVMHAVEVAVYNTIPEVELSLNKPDDMYRIVRRLLEINPYIVGSTVAFEPYYYKEKGEQFSPYAYRSVDNNIQTKQLGTSDYEYHYMDWYQIPKLLKKNYWSEPYYDRGGGEQMMTTFAHPLYDKKGNMYAIITADISLEWVSDLLRKSDIDFNNKALELNINSDAELQAELERDDKQRSTEELGDFLFSVINAARLYHLNPDNALEHTNQKFIRRFTYVEQHSIREGKPLTEMTLEEMDKLWDEAKALEK